MLWLNNAIGTQCHTNLMPQRHIDIQAQRNRKIQNVEKYRVTQPHGVKQSFGQMPKIQRAIEPQKDFKPYRAFIEKKGPKRFKPEFKPAPA